MLTTLKGISDSQDRLHPRLTQADSLLPYRPFGRNQKGKPENGYITLLFLGWKIFCKVGVEAESELESIFSGRSQSRLKLADFAALI